MRKPPKVHRGVVIDARLVPSCPRGFHAHEAGALTPATTVTSEVDCAACLREMELLELIPEKPAKTRYARKPVV